MNQFLIVFLIIVLGLGFSNVAFGQGVQTSGGVDVPGSWYLGEGLKKGDYFEYSLCELDLHDCAPIKFQLWIKGQIPNGSETLWDTELVVYDGNKIIKGSMGLGTVAAEPITFDDSLHDYAIAFKSSISWLSAFATNQSEDFIHGPKKFSAAAWGKIGAIGGSQLIPKRVETITTPAGTADAIVVGWYSGNNNEIWVVDDFPFPVKALTYAWVTTGIAPVMYQFTLLDYKEHVVDDPFVDINSTVSKEELLGCTTDFYQYVNKHITTNTFSMLIQYSYAPEIPMEGCNIDWKINFKNVYNENEFIDQVHYDIWVVDDNGTLLRSYANELGRDDLFNGFGQLHVLLPIEEKAGLVHYVIFVYGTGGEFEVPDPSMGGYVGIDIEIAPNPHLKEESNAATPPEVPATPPEVPAWIKNNAGWWADGQIDDNSFIQGIQFLIKDGIMMIPPTTQGTSSGSNEIPSWIKNNAGWWADGQIDDNSFIQGIQFLIKEGIMTIPKSTQG